MKHLATLILLIITLGGQAQVKQPYNLGFEHRSHEQELSDDWFKWGEYALTIDTLSYAGNKSGKITADDSGSSFGSIAYSIPAHFKGKKIRLEGYMKTKDVAKGFAGLLLRVDGKGAPLAFDNMKDQKITGTRDWQKYTITLDYPEGAEKIWVGGILVGKGEVWFDDFKVRLDGKNIQSLAIVERPTFKARLDKQFDQGSSIVFPEVQDTLVRNLELLGRIWGFLKYHHPEIGKGNYNWDYELFRFLPDYLTVSDEVQRDSLLSDWIKTLGEVPTCETCTSSDGEIFHKPDLKWINNGGLSQTLTAQLLFIYENRHQGSHYYIGMVPNVRNPEFKNENPYPHMPHPDEGYRLLALFRYWNMIHYFFPYKHLTDKDWNQVLASYIPTFIHADTELAYEFAAVQLIGEIGDSHANIWHGGNKIDEWKGTYYPPIHVRFIESQLVVVDFYNPELASATGLKTGDVITTINGQAIEEIITAKSPYYPASNEPTRMRDLSADLLRSDSREIEITYLREKEQEQVRRLQLYPKDSLNIYRWYRKDQEKCYQLLAHNIGYITLKSIKPKDTPRIRKAFKDTKGIIIDIRNYPSAFVPFTLAPYFASGSSPFVKFTKGNIDHPGEFTFTPTIAVPGSGKTYSGKLVVLVNELSQSQAEYTAMAFRAGDHTTIIGSTTAGADGNISTLYLPGGLRSTISGIGVYYPDGGETQRVGIVPDIEVKPTIKGIREGKDELLEAAIEFILEE